MLPLVAATFLLQWAAGGMLFVWVTSRRREVGLGYGWLMRGIFAVMAAMSFAQAANDDSFVGRDLFALIMFFIIVGGLASSILRRKAGVSGQHEAHSRRSERVAAMTGIERTVAVEERTGKEFSPNWDLAAVVMGTVGLAFDAFNQSDVILALTRTLIGAAFLGCVTDAMLLGHWYLVQPGLPRAALNQLVRWLLVLTPIEAAVMLLPTGMFSVLLGNIDDGYNGVLGYMWLGCAVTTGVLAIVTRAALKERAYTAVMASTGLLYLAILTAFGTDLIARAVLAGTF